jgi:hypothetical protein
VRHRQLHREHTRLLEAPPAARPPATQPSPWSRLPWGWFRDDDLTALVELVA